MLVQEGRGNFASLSFRNLLGVDCRSGECAEQKNLKELGHSVGKEKEKNDAEMFFQMGNIVSGPEEKYCGKEHNSRPYTWAKLSKIFELYGRRSTKYALPSVCLRQFVTLCVVKPVYVLRSVALSC